MWEKLSLSHMNKALTLSLLAASLCALPSCVVTPAVPDMPYRRSAARPVPSPQPTKPIVDTWRTQAPAPSSEAAPLPPPTATPQPPPTPPQVLEKPGDLLHNERPATPSTPPPAIPKPTAPAIHPAAAPRETAPQPQPAAAPLKPEIQTPAVPRPAVVPETKPTPSVVDPKLITNTGSIPTATAVEGDPTRVYNPLDPTKKIRIIDKTGKRYPSGKELKVRGTNFHFYVP